MDLKTKLEMYERARVILTPEKNWCKDNYAMRFIEEFDARVGSGIEEGQCFCLIGACTRAAYDMDNHLPYFTIEREVVELAMCVSKLTGLHDVIAFNDNRETTHERVLQALDCAIVDVKATLGIPA